jgi:hypothetical protein
MPHPRRHDSSVTDTKISNLAYICILLNTPGRKKELHMKYTDIEKKSDKILFEVCVNIII